MSGHSKWSKIKHKKGAADAKRGALFTKLAKNITIAAGEGGGDPDMNFTLRLAMDKAKEANMPKDNIDRAIKKGTGELEGEQLVRISYEGYGPGGVALIIDCTTDNTNRTVSEVKKILDSLGGKMADPGSVAWQFDEKGLVVIEPKKLKKSEKYGQEDTFEDVDADEVVLDAMDIEGVEDVKQDDGIIEVLCSRENLQGVHGKLSEMHYKIPSSELVKLAKDNLEIDEDSRNKVDSIVEALEENDDVDSVWVNIESN